MTVRPLNQIQSHATRWQAVGFKIIRGVRNTFLVAFAIGIIGGAGYGGFELAENQYPRIVKADTITQTIEVPAEQRLSDYPILVKICNAESGGKQFKANGDVIRGRVNPSDIGICQINEEINNDQARRLGFDIFTEKGNEDMAIWMFVNEGTDPWDSSKAGWSKSK